MNLSYLKELLILAVVMMLFWILLSGMYDAFHIILGVIAVAAVIWIDARLFASSFFEEDDASSIRIGKLLLYIPWLLVQIVVASIQVAYVILSPKMPVETSIIRFKTKLPNMTSKVILGNSITLTPGTLTIDIDDNEFIVHSLTDASSAGILNSDLPDHVGALYMTEAKNVVIDAKIIKTEDEL